MIKFGKNDKVENLGILTKEEAEAYIYFLDDEKWRHRDAIDTAGWVVDGESSKALVAFYQSAIRRHKKDIEEIDVLISTLKGFYGI